MNMYWISGGMTQTISAIDTSVSAILSGVENRFSRIQPIAPLCDSGGGSGSWVAARTNAISAARRAVAGMVSAVSMVSAPPAQCAHCTSS